MVVFDIDYNTGLALIDWYKANKEYADRCGNFYDAVQMELRTTPCSMTAMVQKNSDYHGNTFRVRAGQLSFYEDTKLNIKNGMDVSLMKQQLRLMKGKEEFYKRTTAKYSFKCRYNEEEQDYQVGKYKFSSLAEYYGFSPRIVFDTLYRHYRNNKLSDRQQELEYKKFCEITAENVQDKLRSDSVFICQTFIAANAYLYYANKDEDKVVKAIGTRDEDGKKVIVFRMLKEESGNNIYVVQTKEQKDGSGKVIPVRGHLRRMKAGKFYKKDKVIWIDSFIKGMPPEYYEEKRKAKKEEKEDALLLDPEAFITDCGEK